MANSATNERQIKKREAQAKRDLITRELVTKQLMSTVDGRRWVWLWLSRANIFLATENLDPYHMAYDKGIKNEAIRLLNDVSAFTPQEYITMTEEARSIKLREEPQPEEEEVDE